MALTLTVSLTDDSFQARHRALRAALWVNLALVLGVALVFGHGGVHLFSDSGSGGHGHDIPAAHLVVLWGSIALIPVLAIASSLTTGRRAGAVLVSTGFILSAVALVHGGGGLTDLHFHFFVVLALVGLYQDWVPFAVGVVLTAGHHLVLGFLAPSAVFSDPRAQANPIPWALLHAVFVLALCGALMTYWKFTADATREATAVRDQLEAQTQSALRAATEEAILRERQAADAAAVEQAERERVAAHLDEVLAATATAGSRMGEEAAGAMARLGQALERIVGAAGAASGDLDRAQADSAQAQAVIHGLERAIGDIASVAQLIAAVADQTNLLALNATIEAARAGEAGRGFGVVADEVKSLAGQTAAATARIEQTVAEVRDSAEAAVAAVGAIGEVIARVVTTQGEVAGIVDDQRAVLDQTSRSLQDSAQVVTSSVEAVRASR